MSNTKFDKKEMRSGKDGRKNYTKTNSGDKFTKGKSRNSQTNDTYNNIDKYTGSNSPEWYALNPLLLKDAASIPTTVPSGMPDGWTDYKIQPDEWDEVSVPGVRPQPIKSGTLTNASGIMKIFITPTAGESTTGSSAVNVAAKRIYANIRYKVSGGRTYEPADVMMYILAMDNVYMYWTWLMRTYGLLNHFTQENKYVGDALIKSMGFDPEEMRLNMANIRYALNNLSTRINQFFVPANLTLLKRHQWLFSNVYYDDETTKSQIMYLSPSGFWKYSPKTSTTGGEMLFDKFDDVNLEGYSLFNDHIAKLSTYLDAIANDTDIGTIGGDIYKTYESSGIINIPGVPEDFKVEPVYNLEVLDQFANAIPVGSMERRDITYIKQRNAEIITSYSVYNPCISDAKDSDYHGILLNYLSGDITPERNMVSTRLSSFGVTKTSVNHVYLINNAGTEICNGIRIYNIIINKDNAAMPNARVLAVAPSHFMFMMGSGFNYAQFAFLHRLNLSHYSIGKRLDHRPLAKTAFVSAHSLSVMNATAVLSLYDVPITHNL